MHNKDGMISGLNPGAPELEAKLAREDRLRWQSRLLVWFVLLTAVSGLLSRIWLFPTPATAEGLVICGAFALVVLILRAATPLAALTGFVLTSSMYLGTVYQPAGVWFHTALLPGLSLFCLAFAATRFRRNQKEARGLAESRRGRGASQVAANMGVAALAAFCLPPLVLPAIASSGSAQASRMLFAALVAALAEAAADTVSSEIGQALGGRPVLIATLERVPPGTDGAISVTGTLAGCFAAAVVVLAAMPTLRLDLLYSSVAWASAIAGLFADTLIGATLERGGWLNNDLVNFFSSAIAAILSLAWVGLC